MGGRKHPCVLYGRRRGWTYTRIAEFFRIPYSTFKLMASGHAGCSFPRAETFETRSGGEVMAVDVMRWHQINRADLRVPARRA